MDRLLQHLWQRRGPLACLLWPLSVLFGGLAALRRSLYRWGWLPSHGVPAVVVVVGNVVAGGAGKTPVVMALVRHLQRRGLAPAVVARGHGRHSRILHLLGPDSTATEAGDEPLLIHRATGAPVAVASRRVEAARAVLAARPSTRVIVCDDGLQHLALRRDITVCVFGAGGMGNGWLLPAGPLREPWPRPADLLLTHGALPPGTPTAMPAWTVHRRLADHAVRADGSRVPLADLAGKPLRALAGIAQPAAFFAMLRAAGLTLVHTEALPDHHAFQNYDFDSNAGSHGAGQLLICTEKDAVKLWQHHPEALAVPLELDIPTDFLARFDALVDAKLSSPHGHPIA